LRYLKGKPLNEIFRTRRGFSITQKQKEDFMKSLSNSILVFALSLCIVPFVQASEMKDLMEQAQNENLLTMISGIVQDVQGAWAVIEDSQGAEWKIQIDDYTDTIGQVLPGVTIMAMVEANGHAKEVKVLSN
jgi:hypothetical protein